MSFHFLNGTTYDAYSDTGPGSIIVDPFADIQATGTSDALTLSSGPWTVTINGNISTESGVGVWVKGASPSQSKITVGADAVISAHNGNGIIVEHAATVSNAGSVSGVSYAISLHGGTLKNLKTGLISGPSSGIYLGNGANHTIANAGTITAVGQAIDAGSGVEKVTNWGVINGDVYLGAGNDSFTNFKTIGKIVKNGTVNGVIDLSIGDDVFSGGSTREVVKDGDGKDLYKLGGGPDHFFGYLAGGNDLTDSVDGGKAIDAYDASQSGVSGVIINLDGVQHLDPYFVRVGKANLADDFSAATPGDKLLSIENAYGTDGIDTMFGSSAANELAGGDAPDDLFGLAGNDRLFGGQGDDYLIGGAGRDLLWGGTNEDKFFFQSLKDSGPTAANRDTIMDFELGLDKIDLDALNTKLGDTINFLGTNANLAGYAGDLRAVWVGDQTIVQLDVNGDKKVDFSIALDGHHALTIDDFSL